MELGAIELKKDSERMYGSCVSIVASGPVSFKMKYESPPSLFSSDVSSTPVPQSHQSGPPSARVWLGQSTRPRVQAGRWFLLLGATDFMASDVNFDLRLVLQPINFSLRRSVEDMEAGSFVMDSVFENERRLTPFTDFSAANLKKTECPWTNEEGRGCLQRDSICLPDFNWCWVGEWKVDILINLTDDDGWVYAFSFNDQWAPKATPISWVRRRKWVRFRRVQSASEKRSSIKKIDTKVCELINDFELVEEPTPPPRLKLSSSIPSSSSSSSSPSPSPSPSSSSSSSSPSPLLANSILSGSCSQRPQATTTNESGGTQVTKAGEELFDAAGDVISAISSSFYTTVTGKEKPLVYLDGSQEEMRKKDLNDAPPSPYKMFIEGEDQPPQIDLSSSILEEVKLEKVAEILAKDEEEEQKLSEEELQKELEEQAQKDLEEIEKRVRERRKQSNRNSQSRQMEQQEEFRKEREEQMNKAKELEERMAAILAKAQQFSSSAPSQEQDSPSSSFPSLSLPPSSPSPSSSVEKESDESDKKSEDIDQVQEKDEVESEKTPVNVAIVPQFGFVEEEDDDDDDDDDDEEIELIE